jgi:YVTN family beta-propeller protein
MALASRRGLPVLPLAVCCLAAGADGARRNPDPPAHSARIIRLVPTPAPVVAECRKVQAQRRFPMLCPRVLPRPLIGWPPGHPPAPLAAGPIGRAPRSEGIDISYGAGWDDPKNPHAWRNRPCCFLHFVVQRGRPAPGARPIVLGGRRGTFLPGNSSSYYGPYFGNHARFFFRERGVPYAVTLHSFGRETRKLLGRLIRALRPVSALRAPAPPAHARTIRFDNVGARAAVGTTRDLWILTRDRPTHPGQATPYAYGWLLRLDPATGRIQSRFRISGYMRGLAVVEGDVWISAARPLSRSGTRSEGVVVRLDASSGRVEAVVRTGTWPSALAADDKSVWVVNSAPFFKRGTLVRIDTDTNRRTGRAVPIGSAPSGLAFGAGSVWVADALEGTVRRIDPARRRTVATIRVGGQPYALLYVAGSLWVTNADDETVSRIDPATNRVRTSIRVGPNPYGVAASGRSLWVANLGAGTVSEVDLGSGRVKRTLPTGGDPLDLAVSGNAVWVTQSSEGVAVRVDE